MSNQHVADILIWSLNVGYLSHENKGLHRIAAKHAPLITNATFKVVQKQRCGAAYVTARKNQNEDLPLRGFVTYGHCEKPMTACWSN